MNQDPILTATEIKFVLWAIGVLFAILIAVFSFMGNLIVCTNKPEQVNIDGAIILQADESVPKSKNNIIKKVIICFKNF